MTKKPTARPPIANTASDPAAVALAAVASANVARELNAEVPLAGSSIAKPFNRFCSFALTQELQQSFRSIPTSFMGTPCHELPASRSREEGRKSVSAYRHHLFPGLPTCPECRQVSDAYLATTGESLRSNPMEPALSETSAPLGLQFRPLFRVLGRAKSLISMINTGALHVSV